MVVHLFEWSWDSVARECEEVTGNTTAVCNSVQSLTLTYCVISFGAGPRAEGLLRCAGVPTPRAHPGQRVVDSVPASLLHTHVSIWQQVRKCCWQQKLATTITNSTQGSVHLNGGAVQCRGGQRHGRPRPQPHVRARNVGDGLGRERVRRKQSGKDLSLSVVYV